jgi:glycerol uptake facilitator-like aquaporin
MLGIFVFEMLGTAAITAPTSILYQQASLQAGGIVIEYTYNIYLLYMCMIYFGMLLVCTPISGGHFNPALTLSVFLTCPNKRDKISKLVMMITAQLFGGLIGLGLARLFRIDVLKDPAVA